MIDKTLYQKLEETEASYKALQNKLADPEIFSNQDEYTSITKKLKKLEKTVEKFNLYRKYEDQIAGGKERVFTTTNFDTLSSKEFLNQFNFSCSRFFYDKISSFFRENGFHFLIF